jgi:hypothetical protein
VLFDVKSWDHINSKRTLAKSNADYLAISPNAGLGKTLAKVRANPAQHGTGRNHSVTPSQFIARKKGENIKVAGISDRAGSSVAADDQEVLEPK